jgi:hypothetical protein
MILNFATFERQVLDLAVAGFTLLPCSSRSKRSNRSKRLNAKSGREELARFDNSQNVKMFERKQQRRR